MCWGDQGSFPTQRGKLLGLRPSLYQFVSRHAQLQIQIGDALIFDQLAADHFHDIMLLLVFDDRSSRSFTLGAQLGQTVLEPIAGLQRGVVLRRSLQRLYTRRQRRSRPRRLDRVLLPGNLISMAYEIPERSTVKFLLNSCSAKF